MKITVLGKSPSWEDAGGACSGYLIEHRGYRLLLDCGSGVFAKLRLFCDYHDVDAVLISHMHGDHTLDLMPYGYGLTLGPGHGARPQLHLPPGGAEKLRRLVGLWGDPELIPAAFDVHHYAGDEELELGPLRASFREVPHFTRAFAIDLRDGDGGAGRGDGDGGAGGGGDGAGERLTFSADCGPNEAVVELARGTALLLAEATLAPGEESEGHMNARQAGELGRRAGARRLVLTHFSDQLDPERVRAEGGEGFGQPVELAREGAVYTV